jgi:hypothetical protein
LPHAEDAVFLQHGRTFSGGDVIHRPIRDRQATYTDQTGQSPNANPVILDSAGRADIWLNGVYAMALYDANGVLVWTEDGITSTGSSGSTAGSATVQVFADATLAAYNANIPAANDPTAPTYYEIFKTDASANPVNVIPAGGTVQGVASIALSSQGDGVRLARNAPDNNWYRS